MTRHAKAREDLEPIAEARLVLLEVADALRRIDPTNPPPSIDEDYKIAEWHAFDLDEMDRLLEAIRACEQQAERVLAGTGKGPGRQGKLRWEAQ